MLFTSCILAICKLYVYTRTSLIHLGKLLLKFCHDLPLDNTDFMLFIQFSRFDATDIKSESGDFAALYRPCQETVFLHLTTNLKSPICFRGLS